ncbi:MAG: MOSC domain-containing protein [Deltaproteobacteria bacterium CG11_big_fil_rev_8_21_14_0_20_49_13]|nr:MAG: MOSC domain-containing protein [Deltaproteobacteria bacterium CG11_big_fil_rev_8_21_14_0_20_49_13]
MTGKILSINISSHKGGKKSSVPEAVLVEGHGIKNDAHAGSKREISLLAVESIRKVGGDLKAGDFAENLTTEDVDLLSLPVGTRLEISGCIIEITEHGKICHDRCEIFKTHGKCVMPTEGVFAKVLKGGTIKRGDFISLANK